MSIFKTGMSHARGHIEPPSPLSPGRGSCRTPFSFAARLVLNALTILPFIATHALPAGAEAHTTPLSFETFVANYSALSTSQDGGYATTNFTPPWNTTQALSIFATSSTQGGNLGGLEGARVLCQNLANAVPALAGTTWYPLISDSTYDASTLTGKSSSSAPIYNIDGSVIAVNRASLWSGGTLTTGVRGTETGATRYDSVFTGTNATGLKTTSLCSNWTTTSGNGTIGATNVTSSAWIGGFITSCAVPYRLYCVGNYDPSLVGAPPTAPPAATPTATVTPTPTATPARTNTRTPTPTPTSTSSPIPTVTATITPTPGGSPVAPTSTPSPPPTSTPTPPGTSSPTPSVASVSVRVFIGATPVPALPIKIGAETIATDRNGYASTQVSSNTLVTIETGLPAVAFTPLTDRAINLHDRTVLIDATRLIIPSANICSVTVGGSPHLWFPYSNLAGKPLSVPLSLHLLNRILSPSGLAAPAGIFSAENESGFSLPRSHFETGAVVAGSWELLATSVSVPPSPPPCANRGAPASPTATPLPSCVAVNLSVLFTETKRTITTLSEESLKAAARREWKPKGSVREPFFRGGSLALAKMKSVVQALGSSPLACTTPPSATTCSMKTLDKVTIKRNFALIFPKTLPAGLGRVKRLMPAETSRFSRLVDALPSPLYSCP